jgi:hypothetical protein
MYCNALLLPADLSANQDQQGEITGRVGQGTSTSPAADRHDDVPHRFRHGQTVLTSCHRGSNGVSLVLVRARGHATKPKGCQSVPSPDRAGPGASLAVPASR